MIGMLTIWDKRMRELHQTFSAHGLETLDQFIVKIESGNYANNCYLVAAYNNIFKLKEIMLSSPNFIFTEATMNICDHFCKASSFDY